MPAPENGRCHHGRDDKDECQATSAGTRRRVVGLRVRAASRAVEIKAGQGTAVADGGPPAPASPLPAAPKGLIPGADPVYVRTGREVDLRWTTDRALHHVELLALQGDQVLLARETGPPPLRLEIPWLGTYRWRVSARDARGVESPPSADGFVCSVER